MNEEFANLFTLPGDDRNDIILGATTDGKVFIHDALTGEPTANPYIYKGEQLVLSKKIQLKDDSETARQQLDCGATPKGWSQGYRSLKFYPNPNEYAAYERNQSNDVPIFRYADIILTKAEALLRGAQKTNDYSTAMAPIGSTTPLSEPNTKDFHRLLPAARIGMEMMAPSGMF